MDADENDLITCIVQRGKADKIVNAAIAVGAQGATFFPAKGTGVRQRLGMLGSLLTPEKEVILVVSPRDQTKAIFDAMVEAGHLRIPGRGFAFVTKVERAIGFFEAEK